MSKIKDALLEMDDWKPRLTWKDIQTQIWEKKRKDCPCHPTSIRAGKPFKIISQCGIATSICSFESCPFVYWDCL